MTRAQAGAISSQNFITSDGTMLRVAEQGRPEAPVTVVLIHGWTLANQLWDWVTNALLHSEGLPVRTVQLDLRGHGESDPAPAGTATIAQCADDLAELIAARVPHGQVVLAGHSMGGMIIMALAEQYPELFEERVRGAALVATSSGGLSGPRGGAGAVVGRGERLLFPTTAGTSPFSKRAWLLRPVFRTLLFGERARSADVAAVADWVVAGHPPSLAGFRASLAQHERVAVLQRLRSVPTVVLSGLADRLTPPGHARRIVAALPEARLLAYPGAGHMLPLERREEVAAHIARLARFAAE